MIASIDIVCDRRHSTTPPRLISTQYMLPREDAMETLLGGLAFTAFLVLQLAAVIAVQAERAPQTDDATRRGRLASGVWGSTA